MIEIFTQYGLLGVVLLAMGIGTYRAAQWTAPRIDRLIETHLRFVERIERSLDVMMENVERIDESLERLKTVQEQQTNILDKLTNNMSNGKV